jgi:hypothetical protein
MVRRGHDQHPVRRHRHHRHHQRQEPPAHAHHRRGRHPRPSPGNGTINIGAGGNVLNDGLFDFAIDMLVNDAGSDGGFDNTATFRKSSGTGSLNFSGVDVVNSGTIEIQAGTFNPGNVTTPARSRSPARALSSSTTPP